jgi:phenylpropionate dioxygenase-like ring-hydroxylating dioxygenase large terminal subunit
MEKLINNFWHFGGHKNELLNHNDFIKFSIGNKEVVLYNDLGEIRAFDNICPHRGAKIFIGDSGNSPSVCSYHGLRLEGGKVIIPDPSIYRDAHKCFKENKVHIQSCGQLIFFSFEPSTNLETQLTDPLFRILESLSYDFGVRNDFNRYNFECFWPIAVENALEPDHLPFVHPATLNSLKLVNYRNEFFGDNNLARFDIGNESVKKGLNRIRNFFEFFDEPFLGYQSFYLFPFSFISTTYCYTFSVQNFFPGNKDVFTYFTSRFYQGPTIQKSKLYLSDFFHSALTINRQVFEEDHSVCKLISKDAWLASNPRNLSDSEIKLIKFRESMSRNSNGD